VQESECAFITLKKLIDLNLDRRFFKGQQTFDEAMYHPYVSVVTPVYNGEPFLAECIESVIAQDYPFSEYVIVNNCSTDRSLEIAESYARQDRRIRVVTNQAFVSAIQNHNITLRQISKQSEYTKLLCADDYILPQTLGKMVRFAMQNPTAGIIGSYQQSNEVIRWKGLPESTVLLSGRDACRLGLLQGIHVFGTPTSSLYRSDLVRAAESFFPHDEAHADTSACYTHLRDCDFGFIHEVLSIERVHAGQRTSRVQSLQAGVVAYIDIVKKYGPLYLSESELAARLEELLADYYRVLGGCALKMKSGDFWEFHKSRLNNLGYALDKRRVFIEAIRELATELRSPVTALQKFRVAFAESRRS
jgi:glycosyltransferase involved in cell wall biosynthesis